MGLAASKAKSSNVVLVRSSSRSSQEDGNESSVASSSGVCTPLKKVLPFDPRSPAEDFSRTPITVTASRDAATPRVASTEVKVLTGDPRSPTEVVSRTPILVENTNSAASRRSQKALQDQFSSPVVPKANLPKETGQATSGKSTGLSNICTKANAPDGDDSYNDPRSPTVTVPRTPLEDKMFEVSNENNESPEEDEQISKRLFDESCGANEEEQQTPEKSSPEEELPSQNVLGNITNSTGATSKLKSGNGKQQKAVNSNGGATRTPLGLIHAKQCRTVEEEFTKNQQNLLNQLQQQDENVAPVPSNTQFVEEI